jgi:hypothetical protein
MSKAPRTSDPPKRRRPTRNEWLSDKPAGDARAAPTPDAQDESATEVFEEEQAGIAAKE